MPAWPSRYLLICALAAALLGLGTLWWQDTAAASDDDKTPVGAALAFMEAWAAVDLDGMSQLLAHPEARDTIARYRLRVDEPGEQRKDLFGYRDNHVFGLELTGVRWNTNDSHALVEAVFYVAEQELDDPKLRLGWQDGKKDSEWRVVHLHLSRLPRGWRVVGIEGQLDFRGGFQHEPIAAMQRILAK